MSTFFEGYIAQIQHAPQKVTLFQAHVWGENVWIIEARLSTYNKLVGQCP